MKIHENSVKSVILLPDPNELMDEYQVMQEFGITKRTLSNYVSSGKIKKSHYLKSFNGRKIFFRAKLMGL